MPFTFNADGSFATVPVGERGSRQPTEENLAELEDESDDRVVRSATITLTNAQIKALGAVIDEANYPTIVAAPEAGTQLFYIAGYIKFNCVTAYTNPPGYQWIGQDNVGDVSNGVLILDQPEGLWYAPMGGPKQFEFEFVDSFDISPDLVPGRLFLGGGLADPAGDYGGGAAGNSLTVTVIYAVITL